MQYELVSRALAYVSCFSTMSLLMTSMAIAAINVGKIRALPCPAHTCLAGIIVSDSANFAGLNEKFHLDSLAPKLWSAKI